VAPASARREGRGGPRCFIVTAAGWRACCCNGRAYAHQQQQSYDGRAHAIPLKLWVYFFRSFPFAIPLFVCAPPPFCRCVIIATAKNAHHSRSLVTLRGRLPCPLERVFCVCFNCDTKTRFKSRCAWIASPRLLFPAKNVQGALVARVRAAVTRKTHPICNFVKPSCDCL
jgi:hypothetical protein